jgi:hypothetical protein
LVIDEQDGFTPHPPVHVVPVGACLTGSLRIVPVWVQEICVTVGGWLDDLRQQARKRMLLSSAGAGHCGNDRELVNSDIVLDACFVAPQPLPENRAYTD